MSKRQNRFAQRNTTPQQRRACLEVERLEDRNLLDVGGSAHLVSALPMEEVPLAHIAVVPSDPSFGSQYALNNTGKNGGKADADLDAPEAWDVTIGSTKSVVGVIDTGIDYKHVDLYKNIWINQGEIPSAIKAKLLDIDGDNLITFWDLNDARNQGAGKITDLNANKRIDGGDILKSVSQGGWANGISDNGGSYVDDLVGWDFLNNDNDPFDDNGHGTHVAGSIGAMGDNGVGITGVNWKVQMMALKFLGSNGSGTVTAAINALDYATQNGACASNNSWTIGNFFYEPLQAAIVRAQAAGHIVVAAAGNGGSDGVGDNNDVTPAYPSNFNLNNIIAVAASTSNDGIAAFSNFGAVSVDLGAPGLGILSTLPGDRYTSMSGTSMATPHVTGAVALVHALHPDWTYNQVVQQLFTTVDKIPALSGKTVTGGRLNLAKAVGAGLRDISGPQVVSLTPSATGSSPVSSVRIAFSEAIDPATLTASGVTLTGPKGAIALTGIRAVAGSGDKQFDLTFSTQSTPGTYTLTLAPKVRDRTGNLMDQNRNGIGGETTADRYTGTFAIATLNTFNMAQAANVTDNGATKYTIAITRDLKIADVNVALVLTHNRLSDLVIHLRGPDGTDVMLTNRGAAGTSFTWTTFDDSASKTLAQGTSPYHDAYRPEGQLSAFNGKNARGNWELWIEDKVAGQGGRLYQFRLMIAELPAVGASSVPELPTGNAVVITTTAGAEGEVIDRDVLASQFVGAGRTIESSSLPPLFRGSGNTVSLKSDGLRSLSPERVQDMIWAFVSRGDKSDAFADLFSADASIEQLMDYFRSLPR